MKKKREKISFSLHKKSCQIQMRQILASFLCFGENLVKSNEVKTNLTKRSFIERKIRQFVTLQKPGAEDEN